jgi:hypothetical protein
MWEYRKAKGLKDPVQFKESMIVITPQKDGDSSDPRMPLNYAHGELEPEPESHTQHAPVRVNVSTGDMHTGMAHLPPTLTIEGEVIPTEFPSVLDNTASAWASSSDSFSPWVQYGESDLDGDNFARLHPTDPQSYAASATTESYSASQIVDIRSGNANIDPQMLEIDWVSCIALIPVASLRTVTDTLNRTFGTLSSPHRLMMVIWTFQMITCGSHTALIILHFSLAVHAGVICTRKRNQTFFRLLPWDITIQE